MRFVVMRGCDSSGARFACGPLKMLETDHFGQAQHEAIARGGEVVDLLEHRFWAPQVGYYGDRSLIEQAYPQLLAEPA